MKKQLLLWWPAILLLFLAVSGCAGPGKSGQAETSGPEQAVSGKSDIQSGPVLKGKLTARSNKARLLSLKTGKGDKARTVTLKFDDQTTGLEHAVKGHGVIIVYEKQGKDLVARSIKPKLAKLPAGTSLISVEEVKKLIDENADFELVDSRPGARYTAGHLPTAVSIPVCEMKELVSLLPRSKERLLVFYCGGPT